MDDKKAKKEAKKAAKKEAIAQLGQICTQLEKNCKKCRSLQVQFKRMTEDIASRLDTFGSRCKTTQEKEKIVKFFIKQWFKSFVAFKDEVMVLFKGTLTRKYHEEEYKQYIHSRGDQQHWYTGKGNICKHLSSCSIDGWRYEYNIIKDKYGENDTLEGYADRCDNVSDQLEIIADDIDNSSNIIHETLLKPLKQLNSNSISCSKVLLDVSNRNNKHNGEIIQVQLTSNHAMYILHRKDVLCNTKVDGLNTVIEDPIGWEVAQAAPANIDVQRTSNSVIVDSDDIEQHQLEQLKQKRREELIALRNEKERKEKEGFGSNSAISIDSIKKAFGANSLLSYNKGIEEDDVTDADEDVDEENEENANHPQSKSKSKKSKFLSNKDDTTDMDVVDKDKDNASISSQLLALAKGKNRKIQIVHPGLPLPNAKMIVALVVVPSSLQSEIGGEWIKIPIELTWGINANTSTSTSTNTNTNTKASIVTITVSVDHILQEVYRRVWSKRKSGAQSPLPILPCTVAYDDMKFNAHSSNAVLSISSTSNSTSTSDPILVFCEQDKSCLSMLERIASYIRKVHSARTPLVLLDLDGDGDDVHNIKKQKNNRNKINNDNLLNQSELCDAAWDLLPIIPNMVLIERLVNCVKSVTTSASNSEVPSSDSGTSSSFPIAFLDLSDLGWLLIHEEDTMQLIIDELTALQKQMKGLIIHVCADRSMLSGYLLTQLLGVSTKLQVRNCGLTSMHLDQCMALLRTHQIPVLSSLSSSSTTNEVEEDVTKESTEIASTSTSLLGKRNNTDYPLSSSSESSLFPLEYIQNLDISMNPIFEFEYEHGHGHEYNNIESANINLNLAESPISSSVSTVQVFIQMLLLSTPVLREINFSHCLSSGMNSSRSYKQIQLLLKYIYKSFQKRQEKQQAQQSLSLLPLSRIVLNGIKNAVKSIITKNNDNNSSSNSNSSTTMRDRDDGSFVNEFLKDMSSISISSNNEYKIEIDVSGINKCL
jgi:hypothetical protein